MAGHRARKRFGQHFLVDPGVIDAAPQVAILWARVYRDEVALPAGFDRVVRFSDELPERLVMTFERDVESVHECRAHRGARGVAQVTTGGEERE